MGKGKKCKNKLDVATRFKLRWCLNASSQTRFYTTEQLLHTQRALVTALPKYRLFCLFDFGFYIRVWPALNCHLKNGQLYLLTIFRFGCFWYAVGMLYFITVSVYKLTILIYFDQSFTNMPQLRLFYPA